VTTYDSSVIEEFADNLYEQADRLVAVATVAGGLIGFAIGLAIGSVTQLPSVIIGLVGAVFAGAIALQIGRQRAFALRLQAQVALCQVQIEANTRLSITFANRKP